MPWSRCWGLLRWRGLLTAIGRCCTVTTCRRFGFRSARWPACACWHWCMPWSGTPFYRFDCWCSVRAVLAAVGFVQKRCQLIGVFLVGIGYQAKAQTSLIPVLHGERQAMFTHQFRAAAAFAEDENGDFMFSNFVHQFGARILAQICYLAAEELVRRGVLNLRQIEGKGQFAGKPRLDRMTVGRDYIHRVKAGQRGDVLVHDFRH